MTAQRGFFFARTVETPAYVGKSARRAKFFSLKNYGPGRKQRTRPTSPQKYNLIHCVGIKLDRLASSRITPPQVSVFPTALSGNLTYPIDTARHSC